ncbi:mRNA decapping complex subunit 2 [Choanephora cucurbitarum]|uniref:mRNA decapping complex subunit 2 n=1 Tax=Choanephora cucurbitarum TaxID=101091 RepID=A0A1C7NCE2_9FUNG|nr:mRNA decapping complex subunit 2 [Choanephora cucurbitarum]
MQSSVVFANATFEEILDDLSRHCPLLHQWAHEHERAYADFMQYRFRIPVCGAIILNATLDKCLLVKGWSSKSGWGFPKGKINQDEEYDCCAVREVLEETGYDVGPLLKKSDYIELTMREQRIRLYIIQGVPEDTQFVPRTRKEISQISWIKLEDLPTYKSQDPKQDGGGYSYFKAGPYRFYMVVPFVNQLKKFIGQRKKSMKKENKKSTASPRPQKQTNVMKPVESTDALKSLLGVPDNITASPAASQPHPNHQPPQIKQQTRQKNKPKQQAKPQEEELMTILKPQKQTPKQPKQEDVETLSEQIDLWQFLKKNLPAEHVEPKPENDLLSLLNKNSLNVPQEPNYAHRASFVEELLKSQQQGLQDQKKQEQQNPAFLTNDNLRRNSLLNVLQGGSQEHSPLTTPPSNQQQSNPLDMIFQQEQHPYYQ